MTPTATRSPFPVPHSPVPPLDPIERVCVGATLLSALLTALGVVALAASVCGCYSNTGSSTAVGDITALPEISDSADNINVKVYYSMTGARVWTAKDSLVKITYQNDYTNTYCGVIETRGNQRLGVEIEPLAEAGEEAVATDEAAAQGLAAPAPSGATADAATPAAN